MDGIIYIKWSRDGWNVPPVWDPVIHLTKTNTTHHTARPCDTVSTFCVNRIVSSDNDEALILFLLVELNLIPGGQVGFKCDDPALSHPYTGDTISMKWLTTLCILLPIVVLLLVERSSNKVNPKQQAWSWYKEYMFGLLLNLIVIQLFKKLVGSPRPHFFDTCMPEEAEICVGGEYVASYSCTKAHWLTQSNKSFPSGHTSLAIHACIFLAYYLHQRCRRLSPCVVAVQVTLVLGATLCGASRVWDRRHHWWDVLAGAMFAAPILGYTITNLCNNFECHTADQDDDAKAAKVQSPPSDQSVNAS